MTVGVTILFWSLIYDPETVDDLGYDVLGGVNLVTHGVNGLVALADVLFSGIPFRILHVIYPTTFAGAYAVFTGVYHGFNGTNANDNPFIYPVINYGDSPGFASAVVLLTILIYMPIIHLLMYGLFLIREGMVFLVRKHCPCFRYTNGERLTTIEM